MDLTCSTSVDLAFPTWEPLKLELFRIFLPPNQADRVSSRLLYTRQVQNELTDYVLELTTSMGTMQSDPISETVFLTVFMEGLRTGVARADICRVRPSMFDEAVIFARNSKQTLSRPDLVGTGTIQALGEQPRRGIRLSININ